MKKFLYVLGALAMLFVSVQAQAMVNGKPVNDVEAAYQAARPKAPSTTTVNEDLARAWEEFADSKALKDHASVTGLKGQVEGQPNCATCVAWAWNNAGYAWHIVALQHADKKDRAGYATNLKKAVAAYEKCLACEHIEQRTKDLAESHKGDIEGELAKLEKLAAKR